MCIRQRLPLIVAFVSCIGLTLAVALIGPSLLRATPANADSNCQNFPQTGHEVCGTFLTYWQQHGGLAQQGYPISDVFPEQNAQPPAGDGVVHNVQYFERARFEEHLEAPVAYRVLLGLLGSEQLHDKYPAGAPAGPDRTTTMCQSFPETGFSVCDAFLTYWQQHGGLAQQGYPISAPFYETNQPPPAGDGQSHFVQYFQRARFEEHTENQPPYTTLLGLLGSEQVKAKYPNGFPGSEPTATPGPTETPVPAPTATPAATATPVPVPVGASGCLPATTVNGAQACVSNPSPTKHSNETVYSRLVVNGHPVSGATMSSTWYYKTTSPSCDGGTTGSDGIAACTRNIGGASSGYTVEIDVTLSYGGQDYTASTSFTTQ